jgi:hypothetical protein
VTISDNIISFPFKIVFLKSSIKQVFSKNPVIQAIFVLLLWNASETVLKLFFSRFDNDLIITASAMLLYAFLNPLLGIFIKEKWLRYAGYSLASFIILTTLLFTLTIFISTTSPSQLFAAPGIFPSIIVFYILMIGLSGFYRLVMTGLRQY